MTTSDPNRFCISSLMSVDNVCLHLRSGQRDGVLSELVDCIPEIAANPEAKGRLLQALREREELHSTGIGDGIALPHARTALTGCVERPVIVFGRHASGIPYRSMDGKPALLFFLLVATTVSQHLQLLARISRLLRDAGLRQRLMTAAPSAQVLAVIREAETRG